MAKEQTNQTNQQETTILKKTIFWLTDTAKQLIVAVLIVVILRSSFVEPYKIPSGSMIPTLFIGDHIFVNKLAYGFKLPFSDTIADKPVFLTEHTYPKRGDVIVFKYPKDETMNYIKRVIGLPGDTITLRNKTLYINDKPVEENPMNNADMMEGVENDYDRSTLTLYLANMEGKKHPVLHDGHTFQGSDYGPLTIPQGSLFVMGDNRDRSADSRSWGLVPLENVKGKAMFIWLNLFFNFKDDFSVKFRPSRIATWIE